MEERQKKYSKMSPPRNVQEKVIGLDLSFQGLRCVNSLINCLGNIRELLLNNNEIETIPRDLYKLKNLEKLNLSHNKIRSIPPELGRAVSLKELYLNDNFISSVPMELGTLYALDVFVITNNPLVVPFNSLCKDKSLINFCRENNTAYPPPNDRTWVDTVFRKDFQDEFLTVGTWNILSNFYAAKCTYAPSWVINSELRKENILNNLLTYDLDIIALQEIETHSFQEFYKEKLEDKLAYDSVFLPRGRAATVSDKRTVDGCATLWKKSKFRLVEEINLDFAQKLFNDHRFTSNEDIISRNSRKDNVALILVLEKVDESLLIIVNTHIFWDPEYPDVKLFQTILLIEEIEKVKQKYKQAQIILLGDFNSLRGSSVYRLITERKTNGADFELYDYSILSSGVKHNIWLFDSYVGQDLSFTNYTPSFKETIDYIFYSEGLTLTGVLSPIEDEYTAKCIGLPSIHFPSDHILIGARFGMKSSSKKIESVK